MSKDRVYGIDLGTTYSCIAHVDDNGKPAIVNNSENESTTPSVVFFESPDSIVVGNSAREVSSVFHDRCVSTVKRAMGNAHWRQSFHGKEYTPQEVSALILRKLVGDAQVLTGDEIRDVVITCPAYFGLNEKEATRQAGEIAGLNVLYVIPEPTAAALAYGIAQDQDQVILVYDLGGGTFDVTVIEIRGGNLTVVCTGGNHELGGKDWDEAIVNFLALEFEKETGCPAAGLLEDPETFQDLLNQAESLKKGLSQRQSVIAKVNFRTDSAKVEVSRQRFDELTADLLGLTLELTAQVIDKARAKQFPKIDKILLVGGSTYMPQVMAAVRQRFPVEVAQFDPNQAVAKGAAVFGQKCRLEEEVRKVVGEKTGTASAQVDLAQVDARVLERATEEVARRNNMDAPMLRGQVARKIVNVSSKSFGIVALDEAKKEFVANLIQVDEPVPRQITKSFFTYEEGQVEVDLECMESTIAKERADPADCRKLGQALLTFQRPLPQRSPIEIHFELMADGLLRVHGRDVTTGGEVRAEFRTESILGREEVEEAKRHVRSLAVA